MILVMNKKHGVGSTLITYSLGKLFNLPIFVDKDCFMLDNNHKLLFPQVKKITAGVKKGIFDIGANLEAKYNKKFINNAKLIIIPFEFGYESMIATIQTLKYIEYISSIKKPIILILNRLDRHDDDRDFNYTQYMKDKFYEEGIIFKNPFDQYSSSNIYLTYLRNSYSFQSNLESGEYFLDKMYKAKVISERLNNLSEFRTKISKFDHRFFLYITRNIIDRVNYRNEEIYKQDKDMVQFRTNFPKYISYKYSNLEEGLHNDFDNFFRRNKGIGTSVNINNLIDGQYIEKEKKLLKDISYIAFLIDDLYYKKSDDDELNNFHRYY